MIEDLGTPNSVCVYYSDSTSYHRISEFLKRNVGDKCVILCIGTDRFIGDSLGPLTGTFLSRLNLPCPIVGTLENPVHAINLRKAINHIKTNFRNYKILAVDACLGTTQSVGYIQVREGSIQPGRGVGKKLSYVGDYSIIGIVDEADESENSEYENYMRINNVRLNLVMKMSEAIAKGIYSAFR